MRDARRVDTRMETPELAHFLVNTRAQPGRPTCDARDLELFANRDKIRVRPFERKGKPQWASGMGRFQNRPLPEEVWG